ncbi:MAG: 2-C-methyl-D-erythritol 4-phosphate cytidylyltransferase, partial [Nitrospinae bacterium]|nr:2-C-methyl-D-erythritol 4-phosphate cytidylyltransferase [Nitrospinota bacterium]
MRVAAVVPAAGSGARMGGVKKQFMDIAGKPMLAWTLLRLASSPLIDGIVVAVPDGDEEFARDQIIARHGIGKIAAVVAGGATRQRSVANALAAAPDDAEYLLTHDGARPLVTPEIIAAALAAAGRTGAAIAAIPAADTLKTAREGIITGAIPREGVFQIQTPQCFKADI